MPLHCHIYSSARIGTYPGREICISTGSYVTMSSVFQYGAAVPNQGAYGTVQWHSGAFANYVSAGLWLGKPPSPRITAHMKSL